MMIFFWVFAVDSEAVTMIEFRGAKERVSGTVVNVTETNSSENESPVMKVTFEYQVAGEKFKQVSYSLNAPLDPGDSVPVEHLSNRPDRARIVGMRVRTFGVFAGLVGLLPVAIALALLYGLYLGLRRRRLMVTGKLGYGRLVGKEETNTVVNGEELYKYIFEFMVPKDDSFGAYRKQWAQWADTHRIDFKSVHRPELEDEAQEPLLYDPEQPGSAIMLDGMDGGVRVGTAAEGGGFSGGSWKYVLLPLLALIVNGLIALVFLS